MLHFDKDTKTFFPHTTHLHQTTFTTSRQKHNKSIQIKILLLKRVESIVAKGEIAHYAESSAAKN